MLMLVQLLYCYVPNQFRLSSSGISQILYLIEDYDVENQMKRFGAQIQTALSSTQVVDGFFVERTTGIDASVDYLARMHRVIRQLYEVRSGRFHQRRCEEGIA